MKSQSDNARAKPRRRGITLIEMLVVITAVATALGLCAVTIQLLLRLKTDGQSRLNAQVGLERLARQLRSDVHAAALAQVDAAPARDGKAPDLRLSLGPKHGVVYEPTKSAVMRVESQDGNVTRRELYALPAAREIDFEIRPEAGRRFVALVIRKRNGTSGTGSTRPLEAVALLGKRHVEALGKRGGPPR
jgi:type II secretory pathway pseudopilin PulG